MNRLFVSILAGLTVTFGLFWLMQTMIMVNQKSFKKTDNLRMVEFVRLKRDTEPKIQERQIPKKPPPPEKRPPPPTMQAQRSQVQPVAQPSLNMPNLDIPLSTSRFSGSVVTGLSVSSGNGPSTSGLANGTGSIDTNIIPLVRIPPRYPMRAANRRIEGYVTLEFTITKTGTVTDAVIVEAKPSTIFNRAALNALRKWKFKPKVVEGQTVEQRARQTLQFKLSK